MSPLDSKSPFVLLFADLTILLLAYLIFLNALAIPDEDRRRSALKSVGELFAGRTVKTKGDGDRIIPGLSPSIAERFDEKSRVERYASLASLAAIGGVEGEELSDSFIITIPADRLFQREALRADFLEFFRRLSDEVRYNSWHANIAVHTSSSRHEPNLDNWQQSLGQAASLYRFFLDSGVTPTQLDATAYAGNNPAFSNELEPGRKKNRRIVITISPNLAPAVTR